ncbi:sulfurtransferase [Acetobacter vaccinii]|uniref:Sulfurtransferase n=1 Tax=Acetobacter vaccinii TaxID=2592655 RepID=A0A5C1YTF1_9PROT|nr:sulfurtransferase [Acetobacter vaccinii]QEO18327.1 sulfurtransferase [Acetobacter vaccinii]
MFPLATLDDVLAPSGSARRHLFDTTVLLPGESGSPADIFASGHLPGSRYLDLKRLSDPQSTLPNTAPSAAQFASVMSQLGVSDEDEIIFYDQGNVASACRAWWLATFFGHEKVRVLHGGLPAWRARQLPLTQENTDTPPVADYRTRTRFSRIVGLGDMQDIVATQQRPVLDARAQARFLGTTPEPRPGMAAGHMPGARNLPYKTLLDQQGFFLPAEDLKSIFQRLGVTTTNNPVCTCGSGMTASVLFVGLRLAGFETAALYDGSWAEWGSTPGLPVSTETQDV